jgi:HAD superfamily hydrolase (TIGR01509 family)
MRHPRGVSYSGGVLWDMDGTLVDSAEQHFQSWCEALHAEGRKITREEFRETFGQRNDAILDRWLRTAATKTAVRRIGDAKEVAYRRLVTEGGIEPLPGAARLVRDLRRDGWRQAVASSAPRLNVEVVLRALRFEPFFDALVGAEDVRMGKPAPDVFLAAADRLGVPPVRCIVVEDAAAGIEAARRAGMRSIGIGPPGFAPADVIVPSLDVVSPETFDRLVQGTGETRTH